MDKYNTGKSVSFHGGNNIHFNLITCDNKVVVPLTLQSYKLNWNSTYLLHTRMDRTEMIICKQLCWCGIRKYFLK